MENFFAKNIKYLRNKKNIDQQVMAEDLGVAQSTLSCWEKGIRTPDLDMIAKIAKYLNIYDDFITKDLTIIQTNNNVSALDNVLYTNKNKIDSVKNLPLEKQEIIANAIKSVLDMIDEEDNK